MHKVYIDRDNHGDSRHWGLLGSTTMAIKDVRSSIKSLISRQLPREPLLITMVFGVISNEC